MSGKLFNFLPKEKPEHDIEIQCSYNIKKQLYTIKLINHSTHHTEGIFLNANQYLEMAATMRKMVEYYEHGGN